MHIAQLGLPEDRAIKELVVCNNLDPEPLDLLNGMVLGCYQPSPEVLIVLSISLTITNKVISSVDENY